MTHAEVDDMNVPLETARASLQVAYKSGWADGAKATEFAWEQRAAEQEAITKSVRERIVELETLNQSLTMELVGTLDALDLAGIRRTVIAAPPSGSGPSEDAVLRAVSVDDGNFGQVEKAPWLPRTQTDVNPDDRGQYGEHFDGELIQ